MLGLVAGTAAAFVAAASGHALAAQVGTPTAHMALGRVAALGGDRDPVLAAVWYFLQRGKSTQTLLARVFGYVTAVAAAASIGLTVLVGHSGATAVWGGTSAAAAPTSARRPRLGVRLRRQPSASTGASTAEQHGVRDARRATPSTR